MPAYIFIIGRQGWKKLKMPVNIYLPAGSFILNDGVSQAVCTLPTCLPVCLKLAGMGGKM